jgi:tetratricopeptide (TPR) repeat protein
MPRPGFRFAVCSVLALALAGPGLVLPAQSQDSGDRPFVGPPETLPKPSHREDIEFLFGALKAAPDAQTAKAVEARIWALWTQSPSDTAMLLMTRVRGAVEAKDLDLALRLLDSIVVLRPDYVEAWNRRATIHYMRKDFDRSLDDIRHVLAREPRHFGALAGLGLIMQETGDDKRALQVYRKVIEIYPNMPRIPALIKSLSEKVDGRDI